MVQNNTGYQYEVDGVPITFTSDADATAAEIRDGLIAAHDAAALANPNGGAGKTSATASGNDVRITELAPEDGEVNVTESDANLSLSTVTAHSDEEPLDAGTPVVQGSGDGSLALPSSASDILLGLVEHRHTGRELETFDTEAQYDALSQIPVGYRGGYVVEVEEAVTPSDDVFVRFAAGAGGTKIGAFRTDADTATAFQVTNARWRTSAGAGEKAVLLLDLP